MIPALKAEFRKLLTVRSTYVIFGLALLIVVFYSFYVEGLKAAGSVHLATKLASEVTGAVGAVSLLGAMVGVLLMTHEYRYNTIMYTLTSSNSRSKVLAAKIISVSIFAVIFTLVMGTLAPLMAYAGIHLKGLTLVHQDFPVWDLLWRALFYGWGYAMAGLLFAALFRNQVATIVALFFAPTTVESLLGLLLKKNVVYLPFSALGKVLEQSTPGSDNIHLSTTHAALIFATYLVGGWIIAWVLFLRRDAN